MTDRNLYAPLRTDADLEAHFLPPRYKETAVKPEPSYRPLWMDTIACTADACRQGDGECPTPEACRLPDERDAPVQALASWLIGAGLVGAVVLILAAIFWRP